MKYYDVDKLIQRLKELDYKYYGYELSRDEAEFVISVLEYYKFCLEKKRRINKIKGG